jgi:hypothetical protein
MRGQQHLEAQPSAHGIIEDFEPGMHEQDPTMRIVFLVTKALTIGDEELKVARVRLIDGDSKSH